MNINFDEYQKEAAKSIQWNRSDSGSILIPLVGLSGETGQLLTEYKKWLRDGDRYTPFRDQVSEELGDILWYISSIATLEKLSLEDIANENLGKIRSRWGSSNAQPSLFDKGVYDHTFKEEEQLPRKFELAFEPVLFEGQSKTQMYLNGLPFGDLLTDNSHSDDGYRFHDVFHFSYAVVLGWSPLVRHLMKCKRKSVPRTDEVEDGARARFLEEGISAMVFEYAKDYSFFEGASAVDFELLETIKNMTRSLEVKSQPFSAWQSAILEGYKVWRPLKKLGRGKIEGCMASGTLTWVE